MNYIKLFRGSDAEGTGYSQEIREEMASAPKRRDIELPTPVIPDVKHKIIELANTYAKEIVGDYDPELQEEYEAVNSYFLAGVECGYSLAAESLAGKDKEINRLLESCKELNGVIDAWKVELKDKDNRIKFLEKEVEILTKAINNPPKL